jgi:hypothetical protein
VPRSPLAQQQQPARGKQDLWALYRDRLKFLTAVDPAEIWVRTSMEVRTARCRSPSPYWPPWTRALRASPAGKYRAMRNAGWPAVLAALSFLLTTNLSDPLFGDVLGALQGSSRCPHHMTPSLQPSQKPHFPHTLLPRVMNRRRCSPPRSPVSLEGLTLGLAGGGGGGGGHNRRGSTHNLACAPLSSLLRSSSRAR